MSSGLFLYYKYLGSFSTAFIIHQGMKKLKSKFDHLKKY